MRCSRPLACASSRWSSNHLAGYTALTAQPAVHRYLSRAAEIAADPAGQAERIIAVAREQWSTRGYGPFAIFEKGGTQLIGRGGLFWIESLKDVEINYMFDPTVWGRAYATEVRVQRSSISVSAGTTFKGWSPPPTRPMPRPPGCCTRSA